MSAAQRINSDVCGAKTLSDFNRRARVIAFYLPQFHPIPENDKWWGPGFTEWTNVVKARPLFRGHYQPRLPRDLGFYDLRVPEVRSAQAEMARNAGIEGFCYYHYWFNGRQILQRPFEEVLRSREPDLPFCLCWANHSWNSIWQGCAERVLIEQTYGGWRDHELHFQYLRRAFEDDRYIAVEGKPLFLLFNPDDIPNIEKVVDLWRGLAIKAGLKGLYLVGISHSNPSWDPRKRGLDACMMEKLPPRNGRIPWRWPFSKIRTLVNRGQYSLSIYSYEELLKFLLRRVDREFVDFPCVLPNWDNTPRAGLNGLVLHNSSPELFRLHLQDAISKVASQPAERRILFLKAWNEWAEGNYVEPDQRFGTKYLDVLRDEILKSNRDPVARQASG